MRYLSDAVVAHLRGLGAERAVDAGPRAAVGDSASHPWMGRVLAGRYRIGAALGNGGMGLVCEAVQEGLGRKVAVKLLRADLAAVPAYVERLRREAHDTAALGHPNIIQVIDFHANPGEPAFVVMELLCGVSLNELLAREGRLAPARAVGIAVQVLSALGAAHAAGIVHRDIKPANVFLVTGSPVGDFIKVLDFGIAKRMDAADAAVLTETGEPMGTLGYMAPEQARAEAVDCRADLYAVGVLLYRALSGRRLFEEPSLAAMLEAICNRAPPPLGRLRPELPRHLVAAIERALDKSPSARFASAAEMAAALDAEQVAVSAMAPTARPALSGAATEPAPHVASAGQAEVFAPPDADANIPAIASTLASPPPNYTLRSHGAAAARPESTEAPDLPPAADLQQRPEARDRGKVAPVARAVHPKSRLVWAGIVAGTLAAAALTAYAAFDWLPGTVPAGSDRETAASTPATVDPKTGEPPAALPPSVPLRERRVTAVPPEVVAPRAVLMPDGKRILYFDEKALWTTTLDGRDRKEVPLPPELSLGLVLSHSDSYRAGAVDPFPGADRLLVSARAGEIDALWVVEMATGAGRRIVEHATRGVVAPDGGSIAYVGIDGVHVALPDGTGARRVAPVAPTDVVRALVWAPDGRALAFLRKRFSAHGVEAWLDAVPVAGGSVRTVVTDARLAFPESVDTVAWPRASEILFTMAHGGVGELGCALFAAPIGPHLEPAGAPRERTRWPDERVVWLSAPAGSERLLALKVRAQHDVYVAPLTGGGTRLGAPQRLTIDDRQDRSSGWLPDGRVLFLSNRYGTWDVLAQAPGDANTSTVAGGPAWETWARPLGIDAVLHWRFVPPAAGAPSEASLVRTSLPDGKSTTVLRAAMEESPTLVGRPPPTEAHFACPIAPEARCVLSEPVGDSHVFTTFDRGTGERGGPFYARVRAAGSFLSWDLAPDGRTIALIHYGEQLTLVSVPEGTAREIAVTPKGKLQHLTFLPDGRALVASALNVGALEYALMRVGFDGRADVLASSANVWMAHPAVSADGRSLAYTVRELDMDVWLFDGL